MKGEKRHRLLWRLVWWPVRLWMLIRFNYRPRVSPVKGPALIVSNHVTDLDPLFLGLTIKNPAYFVASEHVFRRPHLSRLLMWAQAPIVRMKGTTGGDTALVSIRRLRKGCSVAVFPEGNRTFNGVTGDIVESTAKLAKVSGASLVTHRFRGGYFTSPRWAGNDMRRGLFTGEIVNTYSPETLKTMTAAQVADIIRADIYEDAYATQAERKIPYRGRNLAQYLERALCLCPACGGMGTLHSEGDSIGCARCGLAATYTPLGYLEGADLPFRTVTEWDRWQAEQLQLRADAADSDDTPLASDEDIDLYELQDDFRELPAARGTLRLFRDRFECAGRALPFREVTGIGINGPQTVIVSAGARHFTLKSEKVRNLRKYITLFHAFTAPDKLLSI